MNRYLSFICAALAGVSLFAQPRFVADAEIRKTGEILFQKPHTVVFGFVNKGNKPLHIKSVQPSCGCTQATYTRGNIAPGERGEVTVVYDAGVLGTFSKYVEVYTNADKEPEMLAFQGRVVTELADYATAFPIDLGNVRLNTNYVELDSIRKGNVAVAELKVVNAERTPYRPELMHLPPYLHAEYLPENIPGGKTGTIRLILDSGGMDSYGLNQTSVYLARYLGDKVGESNEIVVSSVLLPEVTSASGGGGRIELSTEDVTFERNAAKMKTVVTLSNNGTAPLRIHNLQVFNHAVEASLSNRVVAPGKSVRLKLSVRKELLGRFKSRPRVLIVSDDVSNSIKIINITVRGE